MTPQQKTVGIYIVFILLITYLVPSLHARTWAYVITPSIGKASATSSFAVRNNQINGFCSKQCGPGVVKSISACIPGSINTEPCGADVVTESACNLQDCIKSSYAPAVTVSGPYYITDARHDQRLTASTTDPNDRTVYHKPKSTNTASQWMMTETGADTGKWFMTNVKWGSILSAGQNNDNRWYLDGGRQDGKNDLTQYTDTRYRMSLKPAPGSATIPSMIGRWNIQDGRHHEILIAGDTADGQIYHQGNRHADTNGQWYITDVPKGEQA